MSILSLQKVSYKYRGATKLVLKGINMEFEAGRIYAVMGKSGAGKSTLLSLIAGLDLPSEGQIIYAGADMKTMDRDEYRAKSIGVIFQGYNLITNATALENIILSMHVSGRAIANKKQAAYGFLEETGIDRETAERKVLKLSGGEQQRTGIARALAQDPEIIIADEPTGNLDSETTEKIMQLLRNTAHDNGKCVIVATHSNQAAKQADELWGMNNGMITFVR